MCVCAHMIGSSANAKAHTYVHLSSTCTSVINMYVASYIPLDTPMEVLPLYAPPPASLHMQHLQNYDTQNYIYTAHIHIHIHIPIHAHIHIHIHSTHTYTHTYTHNSIDTDRDVTPSYTYVTSSYTYIYT